MGIFSYMNTKDVIEAPKEDAPERKRTNKGQDNKGETKIKKMRKF